MKAESAGQAASRDRQGAGEPGPLPDGRGSLIEMPRPNRCPTLVIAGTGSGVGKTSLTLGLARLFARQGLRVQTFKVGPDFLDPTYLTLASGRTCYNLDGWMTGRQYVCQLFSRATADADVALVEGVMGLFDGASPSGLEGSTAEIARWLEAPVLLVAGAHGVARSLAAAVKGFAEFEPGVRIAGVIANQGGSERHRDWLAEALAGAAAPPLVGLVPRGALPTLPSRHLGLVAADQAGLPPAIFDELADACGRYLDVGRLRELIADCRFKIADCRFKMADCSFSICNLQSAICNLDRAPVRLGIARDAAFHFYYADNLEILARCGAELVPFSPLADRGLPADLDGLYLGGGYPELHAARLADNKEMRAALRDFAASGRGIYAECGGLMYLGRSLTTLPSPSGRAARGEGTPFPMAGVLPVDTAMLGKLKTLGYAEVRWLTNTLWGPAGTACRGHEFHYSEITAEDGLNSGWQRACSVSRRRAEPTVAGFVKGRVLAGYTHLHWASRPEAVLHFLSSCEEAS